MNIHFVISVDRVEMLEMGIFDFWQLVTKLSINILDLSG